MLMWGNCKAAFDAASVTSLGEYFPQHKSYTVKKISFPLTVIHYTDMTNRTSVYISKKYGLPLFHTCSPYKEIY